MVFLNFNDYHKEKIVILNNFDQASKIKNFTLMKNKIILLVIKIINLVIKEFCRISVEFIFKEINQKVLNTAARKYNFIAKYV